MEESEKSAEAIAHELNNIFTVIGMSIEMLSERFASDAEAKRLFATAIHGVERGAKLNQQLLTFARCQDRRALAPSLPRSIPLTREP